MVTELHTKWFVTGKFKYPSGLVKEETKHFWSKESDADAIRDSYETRLGNIIEIHSIEPAENTQRIENL